MGFRNYEKDVLSLLVVVSNRMHYPDFYMPSVYDNARLDYAALASVVRALGRLRDHFQASEH